MSPPDSNLDDRGYVRPGVRFVHGAYSSMTIQVVSPPSSGEKWLEQEVSAFIDGAFRNPVVRPAHELRRWYDEREEDPHV